jgi:hypothetical protein
MDLGVVVMPSKSVDSCLRFVTKQGRFHDSGVMPMPAVEFIGHEQKATAPS